MKTFTEFLTEAELSVEVNVDFKSKGERDTFEKKCTKEGIAVSFGKNKYADIAVLSGNKNKAVKVLKSLGYSEDEMTIKK